jgi:rod shape-determining protein MreD
LNGYIGLAVTFLGALVQATIAARYPILGVHVDLVLVAVIAWAALRRFEDGLVWAVLGGLALDLFSALPLGTSVVALALAALVGAAIAGSLRTIHQFLIALAVPVGALTYYLSATLLMALGGLPVSWVELYRGVVGPAVLVDTLLAPLMLIVLAWLSSATTPNPWAPQ